MSEDDKSPSPPRPVDVQKGYQPKPLHPQGGHQPTTSQGAPAKPPSNPPNEGSSGKKD